MLKWLGTLLKKGPPSPSDEDVMATSSVSAEDLEWNGLLMNEIILPEPVLEIILSKVPVEDISAVKKVCDLGGYLEFDQIRNVEVCHLWNQITKSVAFWKLHFEHNKIPWDLIPEYVKEKDNGWVVMYMQSNKMLLSTNFIKNHSGSSGFDFWQIVKDGGDRIKVEEPPVGCDPLPEEEMFPDTNSCFSTSFVWSVKRQRVDLWQNGLNPEVMLQLLPFRIEISEKYTARFDCGGAYYLAVRMEDSRQSPQSRIVSKRLPIQIPQTMEWKTAKLNFDFQEKDRNTIKYLRYLTFRHGGCDNQFWAGNYGTKMAHACVRIVPLGDNSDVQYSSDGAADLNISEDESGPIRQQGWGWGINFVADDEDDED